MAKGKKGKLKQKIGYILTGFVIGVSSILVAEKYVVSPQTSVVDYAFIQDGVEFTSTTNNYVQITEDYFDGLIDKQYTLELLSRVAVQTELQVQSKEELVEEKKRVLSSKRVDKYNTYINSKQDILDSMNAIKELIINESSYNEYKEYVNTEWGSKVNRHSKSLQRVIEQNASSWF